MNMQELLKILKSSAIDFSFDIELNQNQIYQELLELLNVNDSNDEDKLM